MATYNVDTQAAPGGDGTPGSPFVSIQIAIDTIERDKKNGDTLLIIDGVMEPHNLDNYGTPTFDAPLIYQGITRSFYNSILHSYPIQKTRTST